MIALAFKGYEKFRAGRALWKSDTLWKILFLGLGLQIVSQIEKFTTVMQFKHVELSRIRYALTCGNTVQLLMQLCDKFNYMDRRSMELQAHTSDFLRQIQEQVCKEIWVSTDVGRKEHSDALF